MRLRMTMMRLKKSETNIIDHEKAPWRMNQNWRIMYEYFYESSDESVGEDGRNKTIAKLITMITIKLLKQ